MGAGEPTAGPGYRRIADAIARHHRGPAFGLLGHGNMYMFTPLSSIGRSLVTVRHEAGAVGMADGYFRATGRPGLCTVTSGPGLTQVGTALSIASRHRSSIVLVAGATGRDDARAEQRFDQAAFAAACESGFVEIDDPTWIDEAVSRAFEMTTSEHRPIVLNVPMDVQHAETSCRPGHTEPLSITSPREADFPELSVLTPAQIAGLLIEAEHPLILLGRGTTRAAARHALELAKLTGAFVGTTLPARGIAGSGPAVLGLVGGLASDRTRELVRAADIVLAVGASLDRRTTDDGALFLRARRMIKVSDGSPSVGIAGPSTDVVQGDGESLLLGVLEAIGPGERRMAWSVPSVRPAATPDHEPDDVSPVDPRKAMALIDARLPASAHVVIGGGHSWAFPITGLSDTPDRRWTFCYQFGAVGQTLALAIGVAVAEGDRRPTVAFDGDGSLMMGVQEIDTAVRASLDLLIVVQNDSGFGSEFHELEAEGIPVRNVRYRSPDFAAIAKGMGAEVRVATTLRELDEGLTQLLPEAGVRLIDLRIDPEVVTEAFSRSHATLKTS